MRLVVVAPHPDDDAIACAAAMMQWKGDVFTIYCRTYPRRTQEAVNACRALGSNPVFLSDLRELPAVLKALKPALVLSPHPLDEHYFHKAVSRKVRKALLDAGRKPASRASALWEYEAWSPLAAPDRAAWFGEAIMRRKAKAISAHRSQCSRKPWPMLMRCYNTWRAAVMPSLLEGHGKGAKQKAKYCEAFKVVR